MNVEKIEREIDKHYDVDAEMRESSCFIVIIIMIMKI